MNKGIAKAAAMAAVGICAWAGIPGLGGGQANAAEWSDTEIVFNHGTRFREPFNPFAAKDPAKPWLNDTDVTKTYVTFNHVSGYKYGTNFFFLDLLVSNKNDPIGGGSYGEIYSEYYHTLSLGKVTGKNLSFGFIKDLGLNVGYNFGAKSNGANPRVLLAGGTLMLDVPGFQVFNIDIQAYRDRGRFSGQASIQDTTYQIDPYWLSKFSIGPTKWLFVGHVDFIGKRCFVNGSCDGRASEILAQPELRLDVGNFFGMPDTVYVGLKYNYWRNKFGFDGLNEHNPQAQLAWKF